MDNEFILIDRLEMIRLIIEKYGEENFYISFSGGKDSTIIHYLVDIALPNNQIPRVFINTGIEYIDMVKHVKELAKNDERIIIVNSNIKIKLMLEKYGYPFKSKEHAHKVAIFQHGGYTKTAKSYVEGKKPNGEKSYIKCPKKLKYQFTDQCKLKISDKCCDKLKKEVAKKYQKREQKSIAILGTRIAEGGTRRQHKGCTVFDKDKSLKKFKPINPCTDEWCDWFIKKHNIKLCKLYYPPFNFKRTGCSGCPFALELQEQLNIMRRLLPVDHKRSMIIWKPVYDEYRRLNYRLEKNEQTTIFDFIGGNENEI